MASQIDIYNMALGHIGISQTVGSLEERSKERIVCSQFWTIARDTVLADFNWPFATRYESLALLPQKVDPWEFTYQYPVDCLRALYITVPGIEQPPESIRPVFETGYGASGQVIYSDYPNAVLAYVMRVEDVGRYPALFTLTLSYQLASLIAMPMTATQSMVDRCAALYKQASQEAWSQALNERQSRYTTESEFVTVRN